MFFAALIVSLGYLWYVRRENTGRLILAAEKTMSHPIYPNKMLHLSPSRNTFTSKTKFHI